MISIYTLLCSGVPRECPDYQILREGENTAPRLSDVFVQYVSSSRCTSKRGTHVAKNQTTCWTRFCSLKLSFLQLNPPTSPAVRRQQNMSRPVDTRACTPGRDYHTSRNICTKHLLLRSLRRSTRSSSNNHQPRSNGAGCNDAESQNSSGSVGERKQRLRNTQCMSMQCDSPRQYPKH